MSNPFVAEIRIFPFNFPPKGWAFCDGQILPISQNTALFSLLGTTYGGDGKSNFALPNLQGNAPLHVGGNQPGPGLSIYDLGEETGTQTVTLLVSEIPSHTHSFNADTATGTTNSPNGNVYMRGITVQNNQNFGVELYTTAAPDTTLNPLAVALAGSNFPHNNMMPYLTLNFCIALQGVYPARQ
jgi:microcystin-dependent protein